MAVLAARLLEDREAGVGVLPSRKEVFLFTAAIGVLVFFRIRACQTKVGHDRQRKHGIFKARMGDALPVVVNCALRIPAGQIDITR